MVSTPELLVMIGWLVMVAVLFFILYWVVRAAIVHALRIHEDTRPRLLTCVRCGSQLASDRRAHLVHHEDGSHTVVFENA